MTVAKWPLTQQLGSCPMMLAWMETVIYYLVTGNTQ